MAAPLVGLAVLALGPGPAAGLESADLLFHLGFEDGLKPELARGRRDPVKAPADGNARLVEGLIGRGYRFAGKDSTLEYLVARQGEPACAQMYGPKANLFAEEGTVSLWVKPLPNTHNMSHIFFRSPMPGNLLDLHRNQYLHHWMNYGGKSSVIYDGRFAFDRWIHFALTWRKAGADGYLNGQHVTAVAEASAAAGQPERFLVAHEGLTWLDFQTKQFADDAVIDEVQIFRRALAREEIRSLFERGHTSGAFQVGNQPEGLVTKPQRLWAETIIAAPLAAQPIRPDGDLADWARLGPAVRHGGWVERRLAVLDDDPGELYVACDRTHLYFAFRGEVDPTIQRDPTHVWYPTGQFKAGARQRDVGVLDDDYVQFVVRAKDGRTYRFALNAAGTLADSRDGDSAWNGDVRWASRSDFKDWTAELALPLALLGAGPGDTIPFNVTRSWKLFKSAENAFVVDRQAQPALGTLVLGAPAAAAVASWGQPQRGDLHLVGRVVGPAGRYVLRVRGRDFDLQQPLDVRPEGVPLERRHQIPAPADMAVVATLADPQGRTIFSRTVPFVYVAASTVELANFPDWGRLQVTVTPLTADREGYAAVIHLQQDGRTVHSARIERFAEPSATVTFDTRSLPVGRYAVVTQLLRRGEPIGEDRQEYEKQPRPEWFGNRVGEIDRPPVPWTALEVQGQTVRALLKEIAFDQSLFPARIVSNGQSLLAGPVRLRLRRAGAETVVTAGRFRWTAQSARRVSWESTADDGPLSLRVAGWIEFDGLTWVEVQLQGGTVEAVAIEIPLRRQAITLKTLHAKGRMGDQPLEAPTQYGGYWFGNEKAGLQYYWDDNRDWVLAGQPVTIRPAGPELVIAIPVIQKPTDLKRARTIALGWMPTPTKPLREDWRELKLYRGVTYSPGDYTCVTPNYPQPRDTEASYKAQAARLGQPGEPIVAWYAFGPYQWVGSPEYAQWWRQWRTIPSPLARPDPNSPAWGPACHRSSASDLHIWMLDRFIRRYPQRGIYFDCMGLSTCMNEAHGCGYVDEHGQRRETFNLLPTRRHYERIYNLFKAADPLYGWVRFHDWIPLALIASFCDENWSGEGLIGPINGTPEKNYFRVVDLPYARVELRSEHWGFLQNWLTELACSAGDDKARRAEWYGKMLDPPRDGQPGRWTLPRWPDYEHVAGLSLVHDLWIVGGNDLQLPTWWIEELQRLMRWDRQVRFIGYWELADALAVDGAVADQVVCSVYYRPAGITRSLAPEALPAPGPESWRRFTVPDPVRQYLRRVGQDPNGWLILAPMNNTDADVTVTLRPNLRRLGLSRPEPARLRDLFRAFDYTYRPPDSWRANAGDPETPCFRVAGRDETFPLVDGAARVPVARRNFRLLLLEPGR